MHLHRHLSESLQSTLQLYRKAMSQHNPENMEKLSPAEKDAVILAALHHGQGLHHACTSVESQYKVGI